MLIPLQIPPGVYKNGTEYQAKGRWGDCDLVRWFEGTLRPIGGWRNVIGGTPRVNQQLIGLARGAHAWRNNGVERYLSIGTHTKLFARQGNSSGFVDITPAGLVAGFQNSGANTGYGGGPYGYGLYGTKRNIESISQIATTWSFDNFGENLVAVHSQDGKLYTWELNTATPATEVIASAGTTPLNNKGVLVTDERFVFLLQSNGNRRQVTWSDQEDLTNWQITATTQSGSFELQTNGEIMAAKRLRGQVLIVTSEDAHTAQYLGPPLVYGFERVGTGCGCISRNAVVVIDKAAIWMGENSFFMYDGYVRSIPCDVSDYVFGRINQSQKAKVWVSHNSEFGEVTFYYPHLIEVDSYVTYNYGENHWSVGNMARTTGVDAGVFLNPIKVATDGFVYEHETGFNYGNTLPYAESGPIELGQGDQVMMAKYLYPDEKNQGEAEILFSSRFYPNAEKSQHGPYSTQNPTSIRFTGRKFAIRVQGVDPAETLLADLSDDFAVDEQGTLLQVGIDSTVQNKSWRFGAQRIDVETGGVR